MRKRKPASAEAWTLFDRLTILLTAESPKTSGRAYFSLGVAAGDRLDLCIELAKQGHTPDQVEAVWRMGGMPAVSAMKGRA